MIPLNLNVPRGTKKSKYKSRRVKIDGIAFASTREGKRYMDLRLLERAGEISMLTCQPKYPIVINDIPICTVILDFSYIDKSGETIIEDVKGLDMVVSKLKRKLVKACHGIEVRLIK